MNRKHLRVWIGVAFLGGCGFVSDPVEQIVDTIYEGSFEREENKHLREAVEVLIGKSARQLTEECTHQALSGYSKDAAKLVAAYAKSKVSPGREKLPKDWHKEYSLITRAAVDNIFACMDETLQKSVKIVSVFQY